MGRILARSRVRSSTLVSIGAALVWLGISFAGPPGGASDPGPASSHPARPGPGFPVAGQVGGFTVVPLRPAGPLAPGPTVAAAGSRLPSSQRRALLLLCRRLAGTPEHAGKGHDVFGPVEQQPLTPQEQSVLDEQWGRAAAAATTLITPQQALAAGYVQAAPFNSGVGAHWIKWSLVGRPFDPATPAMLLFDGIPGRPVRLMGFSYWVGGDREPAGFAGPNDRWHQHSGLCFGRDGWLAGQNVRERSGCSGYWLGGRTLWMLHAWVVPGHPNRWGPFAPTDPDLCPPRGPDIISCQQG